VNSPLPNPFNDFNSVVTNTDAALDLEITPVSALGAVTNSSSCGGVESRHADHFRQDRPYDPVASAACAGHAAVKGVGRPTAGVASGPQDSTPDPASGSPTCTEVGKLAGVALNGTPAVFSGDVRIHNIMLAVADELTDELRTINEAILFREFGCEA
jgi:hypothetical protein